MKRRSGRFGRKTHDPSVFDRISNVHAHAVPNRLVAQQILSSFTDRLPDLDPPDDLIARGRSLSIIEIALTGDREARVHTYHPMAGHRHVDVRDATGGRAMIWTGTPGSVVRGYDPHSEMAPEARDPRTVWPGVLDRYPPSLADCPRLDVVEGVENISFCYWWFSGGPWNRGQIRFPDRTDTDPDGSWHLLRTLSSDKEALRFLSDTYGEHFSDDVLDDFARPRIYPGMLQMLPLDRSLDAVLGELSDLGYTV